MIPSNYTLQEAIKYGTKDDVVDRIEAIEYEVDRLNKEAQEQQDAYEILCGQEVFACELIGQIEKILKTETTAQAIKAAIKDAIANSSFTR